MTPQEPLDSSDGKAAVLMDAESMLDHTVVRSPLSRRMSEDIKPSHESQLSITKPKQSPPSPALMFRAPLQMVTVTVAGQQKFTAHKELLVKDSLYFQGALNGSFQEAITQEVVLDDVFPPDFGFYLDILYRSFFFPGFVLRKEQTGGSLSTKQILAFWQLADRFLNAPLTEMAGESLGHRLSLYSPPQWVKLYQKRTKADIEDRVRRLQEAYNQCIAGGIPFQDDIAQAAANCPPQVYRDNVHIMEPDFMALVSQKMIMVHADLSLCKKRPVDEMLSQPV